MKYYDLVWMDNEEAWPFLDRWYKEWYLKRKCKVCGAFDLNKYKSIVFESQSIPDQRGMFDLPPRCVSLNIMHLDLFKYLKKHIEQAFYCGPVIVSGNESREYIVCIAKYEARVLLHGAISTENFDKCKGCGRGFQNIIGKKYLQYDELPSLKIFSSCSGRSLIVSSDLYDKLPKIIKEKSPAIEIMVRRDGE